MKKEKIIIKDKYITLSQLLKLANIFESGGFIKNYLQDVGVYVNEELEQRRGRKLYNGDIVIVENQIMLQVVSEK
ncbi:MAG TPA: RNA-binding S4 domain-containing protein [Pseudogracilibacillus sp.]|nr:RNA-binding S4 domain-containing protein [Pseudogracilibacillus sp.]